MYIQTDGYIENIYDFCQTDGNIENIYDFHSKNATMKTTSYKYSNDNIPPSGYHIFDPQLEDEHFNNIATTCLNHDEKCFQDIFQSYDDQSKPIFDDHRKQSVEIRKELNLAENKKSFFHMKDRIESMVEFIHPPSIDGKKLTMKHFALLLSIAPCPQQVEHQDFEPSAEPLYSGILSLEDGTTLTFGRKGEYKHVAVPKGYVIVFHADCSHCGSSYSKDKRRLFFKLTPKGFNLSKEVKGSVNRIIVQCEHCEQWFDDEDGKKRHVMKYCSKVPEEIMKERANRAEKRKAIDKRYYENKVKGKRNKKSSDNQN